MAKSFSSFRFLAANAAIVAVVGGGQEGTVGDDRTDVPDLSLIGDFLREMFAEKGEICSWKLKLEERICSRMLSNVLVTAIVGSSSEVLHFFMFLSSEI